MKKARKALKLTGKIVAWIVGLVALAVIALLAEGEWKQRMTPTAVPAPFTTKAEGPPGAPVLILLHGAGLNGHMWDPVRRHLDPRYRVIALDLPGYGSRRNEAYTLERATELVAEAARSVAPYPVILIGDSLGGYTAIGAAPLIPAGQLRGLILGGSSSNMGVRAIPGYVQSILIVKMMTMFSDENTFLFKATAKFGLSEQDGRAVVAAGGSLRAIPGTIRNLMNIDFRSRLAAIEQPVLIVNGAFDTNAIKQEDSFVAAAKHATRYRFENTGHGVSMLKSPQFAELVNAFAAKNLAGAP
jgi:pimeloyl-ACP methyl ester carboxylesterase